MQPNFIQVNIFLLMHTYYTIKYFLNQEILVTLFFLSSPNILHMQKALHLLSLQ